MNDKQPSPLELADALDANADLDAAEGGNPSVCKLERDAAITLRAQHAAIQRKDALLRQALEAIEAHKDARWECNSDHPKLQAAMVSIKQELSQ